jgi:dTDP-4-amino-4,6-dideoxygalactose transaminase
MFAAFGSDQYELPVTDWLTSRVISLPIHTELDEQQQQTIITAVLAFLDRN